MGYFWGFIGVLIFSLTLPMTRLTAGALDPMFVGMGRAAVAGLLGLMALAITRSAFPHWKTLVRLVLVAIGLVGFGVFTSYAMQRLPSSHGAVVVGLLPLATAVAGAVLARERHRPWFWLASFLGSLCVVVFSLAKRGWLLSLDDLYLLVVALVFLGRWNPTPRNPAPSR